MAGTVTLDEDGGFGASQIWEVVSAVISYSSDSMNKLFATVGAQQDDRMATLRLVGLQLWQTIYSLSQTSMK